MLRPYFNVTVRFQARSPRHLPRLHRAPSGTYTSSKRRHVLALCRRCRVHNRAAAALPHELRVVQHCLGRLPKTWPTR